MSDEISVVTSGHYLDPFKLKPVRLSLGSLQYLVSKGLPVGAASPMTTLLKLPCAADLKNGKELVRLGIPDPSTEDRPSSKGKVYLEAIRLAAQPEAVLEYSELDPAGGGSMAMQLVLANGKGCVCGLDTSGLSLSPALPLTDICHAFSRHLQNAAIEVPKLNLWPSQLRIISWTFGADVSLLRAKAQERMAARAQVPLAQAAASLDELVAAKLLVAKGDTLTQHDTLAALIKRTSSGGHMAELQLTVFNDAGKVASRGHLRCFGKPNDRLTALTVSGDALKTALGGKPAEDSLISLSALPKQKLFELLKSFIGFERF